MPTDRIAPTLFVKIRSNTGEEFRVITDQVLSFKYQDRERKADLAKLTVNNHDLSNFDDPVWRKGAHLIIAWGYPGAMSPAREVCITGVKGFKELQIEAVATSVVMNQVQKCRVFEGKTVSQAVREIASENGFGSAVQHIEDTQEVRETISQSRLTDAQFIRRWAGRIGFEFYVDFDGFHFHARRLGARPIRVFHYHTDPGRGDILREPSIENDLTARPGRSRVTGRDPLNRADINEAADNNTDTDRPVLTEIVEIIDPGTGNANTVEQPLASEEVTPTADATPEAAQTRARARFRRVQQVAIKMKFPVIGDATLFAKSVVQIRGMGQRLSIRYYLEEVEHDLSKSGYTCNLKMVSDGHGGHSTESRRAVGLGAIEVTAAGRGSGSGRGVSEEVVQQLRGALEAAQAAGNAQVAEMLQQAVVGYQARGNAVRADVEQLLQAVATNQGLDESTRRAAMGARGALAQSGDETETGGNPNRQDAAEDASEVLEPFEVIDQDTGAGMTSYRQVPSRGVSSGESDE